MTGKVKSKLVHGLDRDRLAVVSGALVLGLALGRFVETPVKEVATSALGSQLGINLSATTLTLLVMAGLAVTAVDSLVRSHPLARRGEVARGTHLWIVPGLLVLGLAGWLAGLEDLTRWTYFIIASALVIPIALAAEYAAIDPAQRDQPIVIWTETALAFLSALIIYNRVYDLGIRALLGGPAIAAVSALLSMRLLWYTTASPLIVARYSLATGLLIGLVYWPLKYAQLSTFSGGMVLLVLFYGASGLSKHHLLGEINWRIIAEYFGVALIVLLLTWLLAR